MHVLVVDDSASLRYMLRTLLEDEGLTVEEASCGHAALDRLANGPTPDAVVLDQRMPQMTGLETAQRLVTAGGRLPRLILFSSYLHPVLQAEAEELGMTTVLKTDLNELIGLVRDAARVTV